MSTADSAAPGAENRPGPLAREGIFIGGLGIGQIISWGSLYYSFPLIAEPMGHELGFDKSEAYGAVTFGLLAASLAAYPVGAAIDAGRGRLVMALGSTLAGLFLLGWSQVNGLAALYLVFAGIGLVQAMTLYDPVFAVIARRFGVEARRGITAVTLWGGFASTVFVPLIQAMLDPFGWRGTLAAMAAMNLLACTGLHLGLIRGREHPAAMAGTRTAAPGPPPRAVRRALAMPAFWALALSLTLYALVTTAVGFHVYPLLLERGYATATVVGAIAIIGPAQVAGRVAIWVLARGRSVRAIGIATTLAMPVSLALLILLPPSFASLAAFAVVYGGANGIMTIVRGLAVPEMIGREAYGAVNGALGVPITAAKAAAPAAAAVLWSAAGSYDAVLLALLAGAALMAAAFAAAAAISLRAEGRASAPLAAPPG
ncbi:MFS transporter [Arenibaculum pallidiluteum]|uniref:MFS transporter n=1 Tax=Arenibaculum pallidiluteum TaxID=2812559 RepID=UPI001A95B7D9|nr:MFS transporter [Arenibaculum pallidiluteum]